MNTPDTPSPSLIFTEPLRLNAAGVDTSSYRRWCPKCDVETLWKLVCIIAGGQVYRCERCGMDACG